MLSGYPALNPFYIFIFLLFSLSYIFVKIFYTKIPAFIHDLLLWIGSFWFAMLLYFVLILFLTDLLRFSDFIFNFLPLWLKSPDEKTKMLIGITIIFSVALIVLLGFINRLNFKVKTFEITLPKKAGRLSALNLVMLSDLHLSPINNENFLQKIISIVNNLNPEIILLPGDIFDDRAEVLERNEIGKSLNDLKAKYGVFAVTGNHEFINGVAHSVKFIQGKGITVLRDDFIKVGGTYFIIGRDDVSKANFTKEKRKNLSDIISGINEDLPLILMDHTPVKLNEAVENNIDLQLSGHTHNGQMFPLNFITKIVYEKSWGYLKKGNTQFYVSSGIGSWGPPVKLASDAEIVNLKIRFL